MTECKSFMSRGCSSCLLTFVSSSVPAVNVRTDKRLLDGSGPGLFGPLHDAFQARSLACHDRSQTMVISHQDYSSASNVHVQDAKCLQ